MWVLVVAALLAVLSLAVGHWALALVAAVGSLLVTGAVFSRWPRHFAASAMVFGVGFFAVRVISVREPAGWVLCDAEVCSPQGPWWARLLPEGASLDAGLLLSSWVGLTDATEARSYRRAFDDFFAQLPDVPNAALLVSSSQHVRRLIYEPPGTDQVPCVVFLHGFGGLSSVYVQALATALDGRVMVVAPALDLSARWDSPRAQAVVEQTLRSLPARADRRRLVLVGLSNGAVFGARYAHLFRATVLVSGIGETGTKRHTVALIGEHDARMRASWVKAQAHSLSIPLEVVEGADHGLLLTHADRVARQVAELLLAPE